MATIQGISPYYLNRDIRDDVATRVAVKDAWDDSWQTIPYLDAITAEKKVAPGIGHATLIYRYGKILNSGETSYRYLDPDEINGKFVRISTNSSSTSGSRILWVGKINSESVQVFGNNLGVASGVQNYQAFEIASIFDRHTLNGALITADLATVQQIGIMPDFNAQAKFGDSVLGNRSTDKVDASYIFSANNAVWTNLNIVEYLLDRHPPAGFSDGFSLTGQTDVLDQITETHRLAGMSLFGALNSLIDCHRGLGWRIITDGSGQVEINVFTLLDEDVSLGEIVIPKNDNIIDNIAVGEDRGVESTITYTDSSQFDEVIVLGGPIRSCFTVSITEGTLEKAWTAAEETAYGTAVSSEKSENDSERQTDKYERVYQTYRIPVDWDGESDTATPGVHAIALPTSLDDGTISVSTVAERFIGSKALCRSIPILKPAAISGDEPEYLPPIVALLKGANSRYEQSDTAGANVRMLDSEFGIQISPSINHILGLNHFDADNLGSDVEPVYDYEEIIATVAVDTDEPLRVRAKVPKYEDLETPRSITISIPDAVAWYVVPGTMTGITDGAIVRDSVGGLTRDDSDRLRKIAVLALTWYGHRRSIVDITWKRITNPAILGGLIRHVTDSWDRRVLGTVITSVHWNFESQETKLSTSFADLDFQKIARKNSMLRHIKSHMGNFPARFKGGGGTAAGDNLVTWNEDSAG